MAIEFEKTPYLEIIKENENLRNDEEIFNYASKEMKFQYGEVDAQKFSQK